MNKFFSGGWNNLKGGFKRTFQGNDGKFGWGDVPRLAGMALAGPTGIAAGLGRGVYQYRQSLPQYPQMSKSGMSGDYSLPQGQIGDLNQNINLPQFGLGGGMNYAGGSPTFDESRPTQFAPVQAQPNFLSGNYAGNNYNRVQGMSDVYNAINNPNSRTVGRPSISDRFNATGAHEAFVQGMDRQRFAGDLNQSNAYAEYQDQNAAREAASRMAR